MSVPVVVESATELVSTAEQFIGDHATPDSASRTDSSAPFCLVFDTGSVLLGSGHDTWLGAIQTI